MPSLSICERHYEQGCPLHRARTRLFIAVVRVMPNLRRTAASGAKRTSAAMLMSANYQKLTSVGRDAMLVSREKLRRRLALDEFGQRPVLLLATKFAVDVVKQQIDGDGGDLGQV